MLKFSFKGAFSRTLTIKFPTWMKWFFLFDMSIRGANSCSRQHHGLSLYLPCASPKLSPPSTHHSAHPTAKAALGFHVGEGDFAGYDQYCAPYALGGLQSGGKEKLSVSLTAERTRKKEVKVVVLSIENWTYDSQGDLMPHVSSGSC